MYPSPGKAHPECFMSTSSRTNLSTSDIFDLLFKLSNEKKGVASITQLFDESTIITSCSNFLHGYANLKPYDLSLSDEKYSIVQSNFIF